MNKQIRALVIEDSEDDVQLVLRALRRGGFDVTFLRADTPDAMQAALRNEAWNVVLCDYSMPHFSGLAALELLKKMGADIPFILVSGKIKEEKAVELMRAGAHDYILKNNLSRLAPALERELRVAQIRQEFKHMEELYGQVQKIEHMAYRDSLTGLPNVVLFHDRLSQAVIQAKRNSRLVGLLFVDLDQFKTINDIMGHAVGDLLLKEVAQRLHGCVRATDSIARLGGDEFAIVLKDLPSIDCAAGVAQKVVHAISRPFLAHGQMLSPSGSVGITIFPLDDPEGTHLVENADLAMCRAKAQGRNCYAFSALSSVGAEVKARRSIELELTQALARKQLVLHYQPQVDLNTGAISGMEALVRWQHPERGLILPGEFLPAAEASGLIQELSEHIIRLGCRQNQVWQSRLPERIPVAINISASYLRNEKLLQTVKDALNESGLESPFLEFELTKASLVRDEPSALRVMSELAHMGVRFSIDDFETIKNLKQVPVQKLKINRSFIRNLPNDPDDAVVVHATIAIGHQLGLRVVAEGVENKDQFVFLKEHGCDEGQGSYFYEPLPPEAMEIVLSAQHSVAGDKEPAGGEVDMACD